MLIGTDAICHRATIAILVGGNSSRFGQDKGLFQVDSLEPIIVLQIKKMSPWFKETLIVCGSVAQKNAYSQTLAKFFTAEQMPNIILDHRNQEKASLVGVEAALKSAAHDWVLVMAVDQVALIYDHIRTLMQNLAIISATGQKIPLVYHDSHFDRPLSFPSLWPKSASGDVLTAISNNNFSVHETLTSLGAICFEAGRNIRSLKLNANTEEDALRYYDSGASTVPPPHC